MLSAGYVYIRTEELDSALVCCVVSCGLLR